MYSQDERSVAYLAELKFIRVAGLQHIQLREDMQNEAREIYKLLL